MPLLFSYGTLQLESVQLATFGRKVQAAKDTLAKFELSKVPMRERARVEKLGTAHHQNVIFNGDALSQVFGTVLDITDEELHLADRYERQADYRRIAATTAAGRSVWVYAHSPTIIDSAFAGSIPQLYEQFLVPLIFEPYAADLTSRILRHHPTRVLEIAAGTGVVTRYLANALPAECAIVATDLNQPMLDHAAAAGTSRPVEWRQADAMHLPWPDESFDLVVCQFGVMFFPDKANAFSEARRVLRPRGSFIFNVWDRIDHNEFADIVTKALEIPFPDDPPRFLARVPHGYHELSNIAQDLTRGGFARSPEFTTLPARSRAASPCIPAVAYCQGTPLRSEIEARDASRLIEVTGIATTAIAARFGSGVVDAKMQAHVIAVDR